MMFYTGKGDDGSSGLFGTSERLSKTNAIYEALGTVDELNSLLGICRARSTDVAAYAGTSIAALVLRVQEQLFTAQAELAGADKRLQAADVAELEDVIASISEQISNPHAFVIPGEDELAALFDVARSVTRRAERSVLRAAQEHTIRTETTTYLNRLSSLWYVIARLIAQQNGSQEPHPSY